MEVIVIRGGGDLASGIAHRLHRSGFKVIILEVENPTAIRREVSFSEAIYRGEIEIEGILGVHVRNKSSLEKAIEGGYIPVYVDPRAEILKDLPSDFLIDAIIAKRNLGTNKSMAKYTVGVGPGFEAGVDVDLVVETNRGHSLGKVLFKGMAAANTGVPGPVLSYTNERVLRAGEDGLIENFYKIGDCVKIGDKISSVGGSDIICQIDGILRGIIKEGIYVTKGMKIGDIDPRGVEDYAFTISDKARAIGGGVLEAIMYLRRLSDDRY